jgi:phage FluMu protein Com
MTGDRQRANAVNRGLVLPTSEVARHLFRPRLPRLRGLGNCGFVGDVKMESIRCGQCSALLFKAAPKAVAGNIEVKCRRCGSYNQIRPAMAVEPGTHEAHHQTAARPSKKGGQERLQAKENG